VKTPIPLLRARKYADLIAERLQPFCKRLEIAGSIRRQRPYCGDVDLVAEPLDESALRARILENKEVIQNGPQNIHVRVQTYVGPLDIQVFLARPESATLFEKIPSNWGSLLLCRTGSRDHNIFIAQKALALGLKWNPYQGLFRDGILIASETEESIFAALDLPFIPPQKREV
jgi:DNA polymerase (family 10)